MSKQFLWYCFFFFFSRNLAVFYVFQFISQWKSACRDFRLAWIGLSIIKDILSTFIFTTLCDCCSVTQCSFCKSICWHSSSNHLFKCSEHSVLLIGHQIRELDICLCTDSQTTPSAALLLWSLTLIHQQLRLSGHRVLGDISCDWSTPHVDLNSRDLLPEQSRAKDQPLRFLYFPDTASKCPKLWMQCYSWKPNSYSGFSGNRKARKYVWFVKYENAHICELTNVFSERCFFQLLHQTLTLGFLPCVILLAWLQ